MTNVTTTENPYQSPVSTGVCDKAHVEIERVLARVAMGLSTAFAILVLCARAPLLEGFEDPYADLPALTQLILSPAFAISVAAIPVLTVINYRTLRGKALRTTSHTFVIVVVLALSALCAIGLYLSTMPIGERLSYCEYGGAFPSWVQAWAMPVIAIAASSPTA